MALKVCLRMKETVAVMSKHTDGPSNTNIFSDNMFVVQNVLRVSTFSAKKNMSVSGGWILKSQNM
jgi:hypothetical protein